MTLRSAYRKAINWYIDLRWYWQLLGFVPLIAILLLGLFSAFTRDPVVNLNPKVDEALKDLKVDAKELQDAIVAKQKSIATKLDAADVTDAVAVGRLRTLMEVHTMDELDNLQKEWDL